MSFLGLNIAGSALDTFQEAENVTAQNIANVQTPGASRQIVNIGQLPPIDGVPGMPVGLEPGTQGTGVLVSSITRVHQDSYDALFRGATSSQNFYSAESGILSSLQSSFGEPSNGINTAFAAFQTSIQTLANNPQGTAEEQGVLTSANGLVSAISSANTALQSSETQTQTQATTLITTINSTIDQIAALNGQIRAATAIGDSPNTYEDQRDQLIDTLSTYLPTSTSIQADGSTLVTVDGQALVNDTEAYHLANPIVGTNANGTPALQVDFVTPPNPTNPAAINITGGQLGGLLDAYNNKLIPYSNQLNDFANALASESDRISQAGYDSTGTAGAQLFSPVVTQLPISAGNIQVGILTPSEVPTAAATTAAGNLVQPLNIGNTTVDTTAQLDANATLANPPAAAITGTLTIKVDGITQTFNYNTAAGQNSDSVDDFINSFNAGQFGVTASYNATSQTIVFARDPNNISLAHRAAMAAAIPPGVTTPDFTITDSNPADAAIPAAPAGGSNAQPVAGAPATSLLAALGANQINGIDQNSTNAIGLTNGGDVNAMLKLFSNSYGVPSLQTTAGNVAATVPGSITTTGSNPAFANINVGDVLTIDAGTANQENVTVTAVNRNTGTITFTAKNPHGINFTITSAQTQTLQGYYAGLVAQMGQDASAATTGNTTQTSLASSINAVRQSTDGINIDEETQNLVKFQNAYGAAAHVITTLSAMLDDAINLGSGTSF
jgi:flagellar hook-associated protein 1 FlgK